MDMSSGKYEKLYKTFMSPDTVSNFRKSHQIPALVQELLKFSVGRPLPLRLPREKVKITTSDFS